MVPYFAEVLGATGTGESPETLCEVAADFVDALTGKQTIDHRKQQRERQHQGAVGQFAGGWLHGGFPFPLVFSKQKRHR